MGAPAEMPHADEALKSLVSRFKDNPASEIFTELAAALLARGHAAEALRIAEHGLQQIPSSVDGRIERAAALLALGRPRVAFVELKRALAINPTNRRAMRLLGKVFVEAGAPNRAAELLAQRLELGAHAEQEATHVTQSPFAMPEDNGSAHAQHSAIPRNDTMPLAKKPPPPRERPPERPTPPQDRAAINPERSERPPERIERTSTPPSQPALPKSASSPAPPAQPAAPQSIPNLFSDLTRDLGLGDAIPERPVSRVEVTQIIRRKGKERVPRSPSELAMIEGPIVDTTQPGQIGEASGDAQSELAPAPMATEPPPLFDAVTSPRLQLGALLDDEPLFQEHMPFAVRPVDGTGEAQHDPASDLRETIDEDAPPELDGLRAALDGVTSKKDGRFADAPDTYVEQLEAEAPTPLPDTGEAPALRIDSRDDPTPAEGLRVESGARPLLELSRPQRRPMPAPKLELVEPKANPVDVILAAIGALIMVISIVLFVLSAPRAWRASFLGDEETPGSGHVEAPAAGSVGEHARTP